MDDLNDLFLFASVVTHGNFSAAARTLGIPKSRVSRRIGLLEKRLGVRLLQRSTRAVNVTDVGHAFFAHCEAMTQSARAALEVAEHAGERPAGRLRVSCPIGVAHIFFSPILPKFLRTYPDVRLELDLTNRRVDVIREGYDVAIRIRSIIEDSNLVLRNFGISDQLLVCSPLFLKQFGPFPTVEALRGVKGVGPGGLNGERPQWRLSAPGGTSIDLEYVSAFTTDDVYLLEQAALAGVGVAQLPFNLCAEAITDGRLVELLPDHRLSVHQLHAVFASRRGLVPAVRAFIECLAAELPGVLAEASSLYKDVAKPRVQDRPSETDKS